METFDNTEFCSNWTSAFNKLMNSPAEYKTFDNELKSEMNIAVLAVKSDPSLFEVVPDGLKANELFAKMAIKLREENFLLIPKSKQKDEEFIYECVLHNHKVIRMLSKNVLGKKFQERLSGINSECKFLVRKRLFDFVK